MFRSLTSDIIVSPQIGVDAVSHCDSGHRDARLLRGPHCLRLELGAVNSPAAA